MPTPEAIPPEAASLTIEDLVAALKRRLEELERSVAWLARRIGVADSTLRYWLDERPDMLRVTVWLAMLDALGMTWDDVLSLERSAA